MSLSIGNGHVVTADGVFDAARIVVDGDIIVRIETGDAVRRMTPDIDLNGGWLVPGFIDTQVNGGAGVLFNDHVDVEGIRAIGAAHAHFGTTAFLPTLISDEVSRIEVALDAVDQAISARVPGVLGVHIEGPFINEARKGIHDATVIRRIDDEIVTLLTRPRKGKVMLTIAPEFCDLTDLARLTAAGVIVSMGHSNATYDEAMAAIATGVSGVTHLFNAMSPLAHRAPGLVGAALDSRDCFCGLIVDGAHVHDAAVRIAIAAKGGDRIMLVTDAMPSVGAQSKDFLLQGKLISVKSGICRYEDGTLAGSDLDMAAAVRNTIRMTGLDVPTVAGMASATPAEFLGLGPLYGTLAVGKRADWVWLDAALHPCGTFIGGQVYPSIAHPASQLSSFG